MTASEQNRFDSDLRRAAHHEAAHAVIAEKFGSICDARIYHNPNGNDDDLNYVVGKTTFFTPVKRARDRRVVALAGLVAESILTDGLDSFLACEFVEWLDPEWGIMSLSATDAEAAIGYTEKDVGRCIALVSMHWPEIQQRAIRLAEFVRPGDWLPA